MEVNDVIGWVASALLVLTIATELRKQWREKTAAGVSKWLFAGQCAAGIGFVIYSYNLENWVFLFTNATLVLENCLGFYFTLKFAKKKTPENR